MRGLTSRLNVVRFSIGEAAVSCEWTAGQALLATEGVTLDFKPDAIRRLAQIAWQVNEKTENIGARRLATVMERLLDEISFEAPNRSGQTLQLDAAAVDGKLAALAANEDLSRFIL